MREMPLVLFSVLSQAAVGLILIAAMLQVVLGADRHPGLTAVIRTAGRLALPVALVGLVASIWHLGSPGNALGAFRNLGSSWLSREVLLMGLFVAGAALCFALWQWRPEAVGAQKAAGVVTALVGLALIYATGMVYQLPTRPDWTHWSNLAAGFVTAALIGTMAIAALAALSGSLSPEVRRIVGWVALGAAALLLVGLATYAPYLMGVSGSTAAALFGSPWFWVRLLVGLGLPLLVAARLVAGEQPSATLASVALVAALAGELMGRTLFYESVLGQLPLF